jgi:hypothetical protein
MRPNFCRDARSYFISRPGGMVGVDLAEALDGKIFQGVDLNIGASEVGRDRDPVRHGDAQQARALCRHDAVSRIFQSHCRPGTEPKGS